MVWKSGESGNKAGAVPRKLFADALHALISLPWDGKMPELPIDGSQKLMHALAHKLVSEAMGNQNDPKTALLFIQEICDRAYGRPKQALTGGDDDDKPLIPSEIKVSFIKPNED